MRKIISIISILGISAGAIGTWYFSVEKVIVDRCGGGVVENGIQTGHTACRIVYSTSPWVWLFIAVLIASAVGLILSTVVKSSKSVH